MGYRDCVLLISCLTLACPAIAQKATPCFTITVDSKMRTADGKHTEQHYFQETYANTRPGTMAVDNPMGTCSILALDPGMTHQFYLTDIHAESRGRDGNSSASTRLDGVTEQNRETSVTITRKEKGAILEFSTDSPTPSSEDCQECIHSCAAQNFEPFPNTFELTEDDLKHLGSVTKTISLTMSPGQNTCLGEATATLNAKMVPKNSKK